MPSSRSLRVVLAGFLAAVVFVVLSFVINEAILGAAHERHDFFRSDDHLLVIPGLGITSLLWGILFAEGYAIFGPALSVQGKCRRGMAYGALVFALFVAVHEVFYFQFIEFELVIVIGGLIHYAIAMTAAGAIVGWLVPLYEDAAAQGR